MHLLIPEADAPHGLKAASAYSCARPAELDVEPQTHTNSPSQNIHGFRNSQLTARKSG